MSKKDDEAGRRQLKRLLSGPDTGIQAQIDAIMGRLASDREPTTSQVRALSARLNYLERRRHNEVTEEREDRFRDAIAESLDRLVSRLQVKGP